MLLRQIFDPNLAQYAYLIGCQRTGAALIIDPLRDIDQYTALAHANDLVIRAVAETHIHADFVSGAREFATDSDVHLYLSGEGGPDWSYTWPGERPNTHLLRDGDEFRLGGIRIRAVHTPGHTPEHISFLITDEGGGADQPVALATGDFLFVGDVGRPDLLESAAGVTGAMEPSAQRLRQSLVTKLECFPAFLQILPGHGAGSACGKSLGAVPTSVLGYELAFNQPLREAMRDGPDFVSEILSGQPEPPLYFATMKRVNRDGIRVFGGVPEPPRLELAGFLEQASRAGTVVFDATNDGRAFSAAHVEGAIHVPLNSPLFSAGAGSYAEEKDLLLLVLDSEGELDTAVRQLFRIGLDQVAGWITRDDAAEAGLFRSHLDRIEFGEFDSGQALAGGVILDVRTSKEFVEGHIGGAYSLPYTRLKARISELSVDQTIYVHCGSGKRASLASSFLKSRGFRTVYVDGICDECERIANEVGVIH